MLLSLRALALSLLPFVPAAWSTNPPAPPPVKVTVTPETVTLRPGEKKQFSISVQNATNKTVAWRVNDVAGGNATLGTITAAGLYTAPAAVPTPNNKITVRAVSAADATKHDTSTITLEQPEPRISSLEPSGVNVGLASTVVVKGTGFVSAAQILLEDKPVPTTVISATELRFTINATAADEYCVSVRNPAPGPKTSNEKTLYVRPPITVSVSPERRTMRAGDTYDFGARVNNNANQTVDWYVNESKGGNASVGTIDAKGVYIAPLTPPNPPQVTLKAVSVVDPRQSDTAAVTLQNPMPAIISATPSPLKIGAAQIEIAGTGFVAGSKVKLAGKDLVIASLTGTKIVATGQVAAQTGNIAALTVENPDPGAAVSKPLVLALKPAAERVSYSAAVRFLEQATWGPTPGSIANLQETGIDAWLTQQFNTPSSGYPDPADGGQGVSAMQQAFFRNALAGPDQLRQRVAFALGQIFVVSAVMLPRYHQLVSYERMLLDQAFGNYFDLMREVTLSPAMGVYLNMVDNAKPDTRRNLLPNENYARELLQLFTLGLSPLNPDGSRAAGPAPYTEDDIKQFTLAFTGWTFPPQPGFQSKWKNPAYFFGPMAAFMEQHDTTAKTLLNGAVLPPGQTPEQDLDAALRNIFAHPNVAPFVSYRLIQRLVTGNPPPAYVARVSAVFNNNGAGVKGDLRAVVRAILTDPEAGTAGAGAAPPLPPDQGHLREPVLYATSVLRALNATMTGNPSLAGQTEAMGQKVLYPPSVFNYFSPFYRPPAGNGVTAPEFQIYNPSTALARVNFMQRVVTNGIGGVSVDWSGLQSVAGDTAKLVEAVNQALHRGQMSPTMQAAIKRALDATTDQRLRVRNAVYLAAASPQYQVQR